jgi:D-alanyl-D-alanine carboxypeptidase
MTAASVMDRSPSVVARRPATLALLAVLGLAATIALAAVAGSTTNPPAAAANAQAIVDRWRTRTPVHAVTVAIGGPGAAVRTITSGRDGDQPVEPDARFRAGSITKTFVATVIVQLVDEHRVDLDDRLSRYVRATPWGDVTLRQLLNHTGGVPDYAQAAGFTDDLLDRPARQWTTTEVLDLVADRERDFAPGTAYAYSNTDYILLGQVIESVTGQPWAQAVRQRVIDPLGLRDTFVAGVETVPDGTVSGWFDTSGDGYDDRISGPWPALDTTEGPAGALVSTAPDLARFARALFDGDLVSPAARREMTTPQPFHPRHSNYGLGVELRRPDYHTTVWGHGGSLPGYRATMWYAPSQRRVIVVLANAYRCNTNDLAQLLLTRDDA